MANAKLVKAVHEKIEGFLSDDLTSFGWWDGEDISDYGYDPDLDHEQFMKDVNKIINKVDIKMN